MATRGPQTVYLTIDNLKYLSDGTFGAVVNEEIEQVVKDIWDRGTDGLVREVHIVLKLKPSDRGEKINIDATAFRKIPKQRPASTNAKMNKSKDGILFNPAVAEDPDQMSFNDLPEEAAG